MMKKFQLTIATLLAVHSAAYAQSTTRNGDIDKKWSAHGSHFIAQSAEPKGVKGTVEHASECYRAEPIWSATNDLVGYTCASLSNSN
jgi:hypothetical protein